eukprot:scaffold49881_cov58-Phaeocystis_antarctica.AAC.4
MAAAAASRPGAASGALHSASGCVSASVRVQEAAKVHGAAAPELVGGGRRDAGGRGASARLQRLPREEWLEDFLGAPMLLHEAVEGPEERGEAWQEVGGDARGARQQQPLHLGGHALHVVAVAHGTEQVARRAALVGAVRLGRRLPPRERWRGGYPPPRVRAHRRRSARRGGAPRPPTAPGAAAPGGSAAAPRVGETAWPPPGAAPLAAEPARSAPPRRPVVCWRCAAWRCRRRGAGRR